DPTAQSPGRAAEGDRGTARSASRAAGAAGGAGGGRSFRQRPGTSPRSAGIGPTARHRRCGAVPVPAAGGGTGPGLPGGRRGDGAQPQRVVRPGRAGSAGVRNSGGGRRGRRAPGGGFGRGFRIAGAGARHRAVGRCAVLGGPRSRLPGQTGVRGHRSRRSILLGAHHRGAAGNLCGSEDGVPRAVAGPGGNGMSAAQVIESTLESNGLEYRNKGEGRYFVTLPGNKKLQTNCWLILTEHALLLEAFVCRQPDEAHEEVFRYLLQRNAKLYGVHYTLDRNGDIYLVGRIGLHAVTPEELDRL